MLIILTKFFSQTIKDSWDESKTLTRNMENIGLTYDLKKMMKPISTTVSINILKHFMI